MDKIKTDIPTDNLYGLSLVIAICAIGAIGIALGLTFVGIVFGKLNPVTSILLGVVISLAWHDAWYEAGKIISTCLAIYIGIKFLSHRANG